MTDKGYIARTQLARSRNIVVVFFTCLYNLFACGFFQGFAAIYRVRFPSAGGPLLYRVGHLLADPGWVDLYLESSQAGGPLL